MNPSQRQEAIRQMAEARDLQARMERGEESAPSSLISTAFDVAKFAAIGYAAFKYGGRSEAVLRRVGQLAGIAHGAIAPFRAAIGGIAGVGLRRGVRFSNFDLLSDISQFRSVMGTFEAQGGGQTIMGQELARARQAIQGRFSSPLSTRGLRTATVSDVLGGRKNFSAQAIRDIQWGLDQGLVSSQTPLTRGGGGILVDRGSGRFVDARMANARFFTSQVYNLASQIQVPFFGVRPADIVASVFRPFTPASAAPFAGVVRPGVMATEGVQVPNAFSYVMGGELRSYTPDGFRIVASGLKLGRGNTRAAEAHMQRYGLNLTPDARDLERSLARGGRGGLGGWFDSIQQSLGIGPAFATRDHIFRSAVMDPMRRMRSGVVRRADYVSRADNVPFFKRFIENLRAQSAAQAAGTSYQEYMGEAVANTLPLNKLDILKANFGSSRRAYSVRPGVQGPASAADLAFPGTRRANYLPGSSPMPLGSAPRPGTLGSSISNLAHNEFYAYGGSFGEAFADVANMMTNRLNDLIGWTTGMGFRPTIGHGAAGGLAAAGKNLAKIYGLYGVGAAGVGYLGYLDHIVEETTGISPKKAAIEAYAGVRILQQSMREATGVAPAARYAEDLMPRSVESGASWFVRTVLPVALGAARGGLKGAGFGAGVSAAIGGTGLGQSPKELYEEYTGERLVPIRKSRYWMLGRQPFEGGQIDYFAPGWVARELSDYKHTDTLYGSKSDYYSHVAHIPTPLGKLPLPTPSNLFGLTNLLEGDFFGGGQQYLAEKHKYDRPYPDSPGVDKDEAALWANYLSSRGPYDAPIGAGERLGMGAMGDLGVAPKDRSSIGGRIGKAIDQLTELGGIYKFGFWDMPGFGDPGRPAIASAEQMSSHSRAFYDEQMGGMFGASELYRRFIPRQERTVNPVPNNMPTWLPGLRSDYADDRQYHIDFTLGDPYSKMKMGEFRLPGEAYERLHRLHSGSPGVYDAMDRYLVLADVAPHSHARKEYQAIVEGWSRAGVLDNYWAEKFQTTKEQVKQKMEKFNFAHRRFTGMITDPNPDKTRQKYTFLEKAIGGGWEMLTHDLVPAFGDAVPIAGPLLADKLLVARSPVEEYLKSELYGEEFADWRHPWEAWMRPKANLLTASHPLTAAVGGAGLGLLGSTAMSQAAIGISGGLYFGGRSLAREVTGETFIPSHRKQEWELQEYFDNLRYLKSSALLQQAQSSGDTELQRYYTGEVARTTAGIDYRQGTREFISSALRGLPRSTRAFFMPFMQMPQESQEAILPYLPEHIQPVFAASWAKSGQRPGDYDSYAGIFAASPDERAAGYFSVNELPGPDWPGWHPDVPLDAVKIKMVDTGTNSVAADIHKFDLFPEHRFRASRFANLPNPEVGDLEHPQIESDSDLNLQRTLESAGFRDVNVRPAIGPSYGSGVSWGIRYDNMPGFRDVINRLLR